MADRTLIRRVTNGHSWFTLDGCLMPSPSKIKLSQPFLDNYHAEVAADVVTDCWEDLAGRAPSDRRKFFVEKTVSGFGKPAEDGKLRHSLMEALAKGEKATSDDAGAVVDAECAKRAMERYGIVPVESELMVVNTSTWCAGTTDMIANVAGYGRVVMDFKFGKEVWPDYALQLSAYAHMTNTIVEVEHRGVRGGVKPSTWELGTMPKVRTDVALLLHTHDGVSDLYEVKTNGWVWSAVVAWCRAWWLADPRMRPAGPFFESPLTVVEKEGF